MLNFTSTLSYGLRLLLNLAKGEQRPRQLKMIAQEEGISLPYLRKIAAPLERAGIIRSLRGPGGGYMLKKKPDDIALIEIINILTRTKVMSCVKTDSSCKRSSHCAVKNLLHQAYVQFQLVFEPKTVATLLQGGPK
jgi:Rrf2 family protein